jgi:hypothetical protein
VPQPPAADLDDLCGDADEREQATHDTDGGSCSDRDDGSGASGSGSGGSGMHASAPAFSPGGAPGSAQWRTTRWADGVAADAAAAAAAESDEEAFMAARSGRVRWRANADAASAAAAASNAANAAQYATHGACRCCCTRVHASRDSCFGD